MGAKIFPGTPCMVKSGMNETRMMSVAKMTGREPSPTPATITSDSVSPCRRRLRLAEDIFENNDRCVDQNAEVDGANGDEIG